MKRTIMIPLTGALLLGAAMAAPAQVLQRPGPEFYRMPDRVAPPAAGERAGFRIRVQRRATPEGYLIRIDTGGDPDQVQIERDRNTLVISSSRSVEREQRSDRGWYRFSRVSSGYRQRVRLPRDANLDQMEREEKDGVITLTIPRQRPQYRGHGYYRGPR